ncbi:MAG: SCP2 sterol-binding domain-containing protein [Candidatus Obscuribacterales bacterium]|nr:SCP2 sterol-binding domain-containing protein [Steroidobacteraceae bacterium]
MLNRNIAASASASATCHRLEGKTLAVEFVAAPGSPLFKLYVRSRGTHIALDTQPAGASDATLSGTPLSYFGMLGQAPENALRAGDVRIEGNAEVAQAFRDLLQTAQPDFEEELSRVIGDVGAHQVGKFARALLGFGRRVGSTMAQNVSEYLQEESRDVPARIEVDEFNHAVDNLRDDVERAEARLTRLERTATTHSLTKSS